jgi:hypothetical protein
MRYVIDGRRNPELFLPHELFDALLSGLSADETERANQRAFFAGAIRRFGYDDAVFWTSLESVAADYLPTKNMSCAGSRSEVSLCVRRRCVSRYHALETARSVFGSENFDRFLYTVIAPTMQLASASLDKNLGVSLRNAEFGCQR